VNPHHLHARAAPFAHGALGIAGIGQHQPLILDADFEVVGRGCRVGGEQRQHQRDRREPGVHLRRVSAARPARKQRGFGWTRDGDRHAQP